MKQVNPWNPPESHPTWQWAVHHRREFNRLVKQNNVRYRKLTDEQKQHLDGVGMGMSTKNFYNADAPPVLCDARMCKAMLDIVEGTQ